MRTRPFDVKTSRSRRSIIFVPENNSHAAQRVSALETGNVRNTNNGFPLLLEMKLRGRFLGSAEKVFPVGLTHE